MKGTTKGSAFNHEGPFCADPACEVCFLWPRPGETDDEWKTRLKARYGNAFPDEHPERTAASHAVQAQIIATGRCHRCGALRRVNAPCAGCRERVRARWLGLEGEA